MVSTLDSLLCHCENKAGINPACTTLKGRTTVTSRRVGACPRPRHGDVATQGLGNLDITKIERIMLGLD